MTERKPKPERRYYHRDEAMILMVVALQETLGKEATLLEVELSSLGLSPLARGTIFDRLSQLRTELEAELQAPGAYEKYKAKARTLGRLPRIGVLMPKEVTAP